MQKFNFILFVAILLMVISCNPDTTITPTPPDNNSNPPTTNTTTVLPTNGIICPEGIEIDEDSIPQIVLDYISINHPNVELDEVSELEHDGIIHYGIELEDETHILLDVDGNLIAQGIENEMEIEVDSLPSIITDYITTNYPNAEIEEAEQEDKYGNTYIEIEIELNDDDEISLIFDIDGNFLCLEEDDDDDDDGNNGGNNNDDDFANLPQVIQDFITNNFGNYTFKDADEKTTCDGTPILEIKLEDANEDKLWVAFDMTGNQIYTSNRILVDDLPSAITASITTNYPNYTIGNKPRILDFSNSSTQYRVSLDAPSGQEDLKVWLASDGTVICEKED